MDRAAAAYEAAHNEAEQHDVAGDQAHRQAQRAFVLTFTAPVALAADDDEIDLAQQLLSGLDLRATAFTARIAALVRNAGRDDADVEDRARLLRADIHAAGLAYVAFRHAVRDAQTK